MGGGLDGEAGAECVLAGEGASEERVVVQHPLVYPESDSFTGPRQRQTPDLPHINWQTGARGLAVYLGQCRSASDRLAMDSDRGSTELGTSSSVSPSDIRSTALNSGGM